MLKQTNPWNKPVSADSCVREVPFTKLDPQLIEDAANGGTMLIERFAAGMWGGFGKVSENTELCTYADAARICAPKEDHDILQKRKL
jgi:hypothetical protein